MPHIYPAAPATISGDNLTISRFLNSPTLVQRELRSITTQRFIADVLLTGRYEASGGSVLYEQTEGIYTSKAPEAVAPGAEYPRAAAVPGPAAVAAITKWGQDVPVTDEHVGRYGRRAVDTALTKISNYIIKQVDSVALTVINSAITASAATTGSVIWSAATADPLLDVMLAAAAVRGLDQGYDPDTVVMNDTAYARLVANQKIIAGLNREDDNTVTRTGNLLVVAGLRILPTNNMPGGAATSAFVIDSKLFGGLGYERIPSPEYSGDPANGVESWTRRDPDANDQWIIRGRRPVVPLVQEPGAGYKITGVTS